MRIILAIATAMLATPCLAQSVQPFVECAGKVSDAERLACYDRAVESLSGEARRIAAQRKVASDQAAAVAAAAAAKAAADAAVKAQADAKDSFGREGIKMFGQRGEAEVGEVTATVTEVLRDSVGKVVVVMDNGQIWRQVDGFTLPLRAGASVTVKRGAMGSYRMRLDGTSRLIQVIRMR